MLLFFKFRLKLFKILTLSFSSGLVNYWPIENNVNVGGAHMIPPGSGSTPAYAPDRFGVTNSALFINNNY